MKFLIQETQSTAGFRTRRPTYEYTNHRCGNNYGWGKFEGTRCQVERESFYGTCDGTDRSDYTFPVFEYCHPDYFSNIADEVGNTGGADICGRRVVTGNAVIGEGELITMFSRVAFLLGSPEPCGVACVDCIQLKQFELSKSHSWYAVPRFPTSASIT